MVSARKVKGTETHPQIVIMLSKTCWRLWKPRVSSQSILPGGHRVTFLLAIEGWAPGLVGKAGRAFLSKSRECSCTGKQFHAAAAQNRKGCHATRCHWTDLWGIWNKCISFQDIPQLREQHWVSPRDEWHWGCGKGTADLLDMELLWIALIQQWPQEGEAWAPWTFQHPQPQQKICWFPSLRDGFSPVSFRVGGGTWSSSSQGWKLTSIPWDLTVLHSTPLQGSSFIHFLSVPPDKGRFCGILSGLVPLYIIGAGDNGNNVGETRNGLSKSTQPNLSWILRLVIEGRKVHYGYSHSTCSKQLQY